MQKYILIYMKTKKKKDTAKKPSVRSTVIRKTAGYERNVEALISASQEWRKTFDAITEFVAVIDNDFKFRRVNKSLADAAGMNPAELIGKRCYKVIHACTGPIADCPHLEMLKTGKSVTREIYNPHFRSFFMISVSPVLDGDGEIKGSVHYMKDLTSLKKAEAELKERIMLAELSADIAVSLNRSESLQQTLQHCTEILVQQLHVSFARIWTLNPSDNVLELQASAGMYTHVDGAHSRIPLGKYKIGLIAKDRKPHLTNTVIGDPLIHNQEWAEREGIVAFAGHPLVLEDRLVGVMALFSKKTLSGVTARALAHVADIITLGIKRKKADHELLEYKENLEKIISERTAELTAANLLLKDEIWDRREIEQNLIESERKYRDLFNYMSSGVAVYEAIDEGKDFIFKDFNKAGEKIDRLKKERVIGKRVTEIYPGIDVHGLLSVFRRVWKTGKPENHPVSPFKDSRISGWREHHVYRLPSGEIVSVYDDVTEQKKLREREENLLNELKTIFDNIPLAIVYIDPAFTIQRANRFFREITGLQERDYLGKPCYEVVGEYTDDSTKKGREKICSFCKKAECTQYKKPTVIERPLHDKTLRVITIPELDTSGNITGFLEIGEDISHRKRAESEAMQVSRLAALGELAAGVAHEINNPINGIINYAQILLNKSKHDSRDQDIAGRIIKEGDRISNIVNSLLSFARVYEAKKRPVHVADILSDTLALTETLLVKDGITLNRKIPADLSEIIANPQHIEQVFLNIISNARYALNEKFSGNKGRKVLQISGEEITIDGSPFARIVFFDNGTGIPPDMLDKVMNPFFSTKPARHGTGLGLSISHSIITDHGGKLAILSSEGKSTTVTIDLPSADTRNR